MSGITVYEFDVLVSQKAGGKRAEACRQIPASVFAWLEKQCWHAGEQRDAPWLRSIQRGGSKALQITSFVGVIRTPDGFQIEVLPKVGRAAGGCAGEARQLLIEMLSSLNGFRHIRTDSAKLLAARMPLLEVFIHEFLLAVEHVVKRGIRSDYTSRKANVVALRGRLLFARHIRRNLCRADRFFVECDEFLPDRPENRLLRAALGRAMSISASQANQRMGRELYFAFSEVSQPTDIAQDFHRIRLDRGMSHYADAIAWARLILDEESPLTGTGAYGAPSLLFPMEAVFEAFVAKHIGGQLMPPLLLKTQAQHHHLVRHREQGWFRLKPDLLVRESNADLLVLDTKWKLLDANKFSRVDKYGLAQSDFYQMYAYGRTYLNGRGDIVLIYPRTESFPQPLPVFEFLRLDSLRLWVLPFCLKSKMLLLPVDSHLNKIFRVDRLLVSSGISV